MGIRRLPANSYSAIPEWGFRIIFFFYLISWIVPAFKGLPLTPHESIYIYFWFVFGVVAFPHIFTSKDFLLSASFLLLHIVYVAIDNYTGVLGKRKTLVEIFLMYGYPTTLFVYFFKSFPLNNIRFFAPLILVFLTITSITTIFAISQFPEASRALAGNDNQEEVLFFLRMNVGSYDFIYLQALVAPLLLYFYKTRKRAVWLILFLLSGSVVFYAQFTAAVILFMVNMAFTLLIIFGLNFKKYLLSVVVFGVCFFLLKAPFIDLLVLFSDYTVGFASIHEKINEVIMSLEGKDLSGTSLEAYNIRYKLSIDAFLKSPVIGGNSGGGHHYWFDMLALYGIAGLSIFVLVFRNFILRVLRYPIYTKTEKILVVHATIMFIAIGLNKNIIFSMPVILFAIYPLLLLRYGEYFALRYGHRPNGRKALQKERWQVYPASGKSI